MAWGMKNVAIQIVGSSIMEGRIGVDKAADRWYERMRSALAERFPATCFSIINSAVGGESTRELMTHWERDLAGHQPDFILVMFGGNNDDLSKPQRVLNPGEMDRWMEWFLSTVPAASRMIGVILNPVKGEWHWCFRHPAFQEALQKAGNYDQMLEPEREEARAFFRRHAIPFLDLHRLLSPVEQFICQEDGIHLNPEGHRVFAEAMTDLLSSMLP